MEEPAVPLDPPDRGICKQRMGTRGVQSQYNQITA